MQSSSIKQEEENLNQLLKEYEEILQGETKPDDNKVKFVISADDIQVPVPKGFVASSVPSERTVSDGFVIYETENEVNSGNVVTAQTAYNQFVWVPVDSTQIKDGKGFSLRNTRTEYSGNDSSQVWNDMISSINKYGGFYVARYEMGIPDNVEQTAPTSDTTNTWGNGRYKATSKKGKNVWNYISIADTTVLENNPEANGLLKVARNSYKDNVKSTLITAEHWDTITQWLLDTENLVNGTGLSIDNKSENVSCELKGGPGGDYGYNFATTTTSINEILANSARIGNYSSGTYFYDGSQYETCTGVLQTCGSSEAYRLKNIYDMAGNVMEYMYTSQKIPGYPSDNQVTAGGCFDRYPYNDGYKCIEGVSSSLGRCMTETNEGDSVYSVYGKNGEFSEAISSRLVLYF